MTLALSFLRHPSVVPLFLLSASFIKPKVGTSLDRILIEMKKKTHPFDYIYTGHYTIIEFKARHTKSTSNVFNYTAKLNLNIVIGIKHFFLNSTNNTVNNA